MDEPKEPQDEPTSEGTEDTSEKEPITFTQKELEEATRKARSDVLAEAGRYKAESERALKAAQAAQKRLDDMQRVQDEADLETHRDEPEKLSAIKERIARRKAESDLEEAMQKLNEKDEKLKELEGKEAESTKERNAREIAARLGIDANRLAKLARFTDGTTEAIEDIAKDLPKLQEKKPLTTDSGKTKGGAGKKPTLEEVQAASPAEFDKKVQSGEWVV